MSFFSDHHYESFLFIFLSAFLFVFSNSIPQPTVLVLPVSKHNGALQYLARFYQRTPRVPINVAINLGGDLFWIGCGSGYDSSSYRRVPCNSTQCRSVSTRLLSCSSGKCSFPVMNAFNGRTSIGQLGEDVLSFASASGSMISIPRFLFVCANNGGKALVGINGMAGLGHGPLGLLTQLSSALNLTQKFAICLPPASSDGVIFFGSGPYLLLPNIDVSKVLIYTPLVVKPPNPINFFSKTPRDLLSPSSYEYTFHVQSIRINGRRIRFRSPKLETRISTVDPYGILESSIYDSLTKHFLREALAANATRVDAVWPFRVCFSMRIGGSRVSMPIVDLMLHEEEVFWRIFETNSMVAVGEDVWCLGFLDGGASSRWNRKTDIVLGGHQLEDNLIQFDLVSSRLGFTSSLLLEQTSCSNFNFTPNL